MQESIFYFTFSESGQMNLLYIMQNQFLKDIKQLLNEVEHDIENYQGRD